MSTDIGVLESNGSNGSSSAPPALATLGQELPYVDCAKQPLPRYVVSFEAPWCNSLGPKRMQSLAQGIPDLDQCNVALCGTYSVSSP